MKVITDPVTYGNFKNRIGELAEQKEKLHAYHEIWGIMEGFQQD